MVQQVITAVRKHGFIGAATRVWTLLNIRRPTFVKSARELIEDKAGCEIGGPSFDFSDHGAIPLYGFAGRIDNFQYSASTLRGDFADGEPFLFHPSKPPGTLRIREASDIGGPEAFYGFVLSSHVLEHCANPMKV